MVCYQCIDYITTGNIIALKEERKLCTLYQQNNCKYMSEENSFNGAIQDTNITLFPDKLKQVFENLNLLNHKLI